ncbi:hypothetical protein MKEN_00491900 [Mycena kentingensis (nom. inval.)]|nr:hypothetical protein MKEN_00491900 [Mycena kentingensis (nom. inval.)]
MKLLACLLALAAAAYARLVNSTIDDASPVVNYSQTPSLRCTPGTCNEEWTTRLYNGTSSTTAAPVSIPFVGSGVYVYLGVEGTVNFNIDGEFRGSFSNNNVNEIVLAFYNVSLADGSHVLLIYPPPLRAEIIELDYIVYTHSVPGSRTGAIVGGVVGGLVFLALLTRGAFVLMRRRRQRRLSLRGVRLADDWTDKAALRLDTGALPQKPKLVL